MIMFWDGGHLGFSASEKVKLQYSSIDADLKLVNYCTFSFLAQLISCAIANHPLGCGCQCWHCAVDKI